jgi:hypothetical protein
MTKQLTSTWRYWDQRTRSYYTREVVLAVPYSPEARADHLGWIVARCAHCGCRTLIRYRLAHYCSNECRTEHRLEVRRARDARTERPSRAKVRQPRQCAYCGGSFTPARDDARYCSGACRVAAHRARGEG